MSVRSRNRRQRCECDVVVLGGGPAGAAAATVLARAGHSVTVVEKSKYERARIGETLPPRARAPLMQLEVWETFLSSGHLASPAVHSAWGSDELHEKNFIFDPHGSGWHLDRRVFDTMLVGAARHAGADVVTGAQVNSCRWSAAAGHWHIEFSDANGAGSRSRSLRAAMAIDATGRVAALARQQRARRINTDRLIGLANVLEIAASESAGRTDEYGACTLVEASTDGWWYTARVPGRRLIAIYMTDADLLPRSRALWRSFWQARWSQTSRTRARLEGCDIQTDPYVVAANSSFLDPVSGERWLAVGDAAAAFDPLSSQGLYRAVVSGIRGAEALIGKRNGDRHAVGVYAHEMSEVVGKYSQLSGYYYGQERRWPRSLFWVRRHARATGRGDARVALLECVEGSGT
jgi:flavin-dependent dehydrogenase